MRMKLATRFRHEFRSEMMYVRRTIKPVAIAWLVCHLWMVLVAGIFVSTQGSVESAEITCHCQHGDGHECPMHKSASGRSRCALGSAAAGPGVVLLGLLGGLGVPPVAVQDRHADPLAGSVRSFCAPLRDYLIPPQLPPPRA
jgi:hypothetical protein